MARGSHGGGLHLGFDLYGRGHFSSHGGHHKHSGGRNYLGSRYFGGKRYFGGNQRYYGGYNYRRSNNYYPRRSSTYTSRYNSPTRAYTPYLPSVYSSRVAANSVYISKYNDEPQGTYNNSINSSGWYLLAQNNAREALRVFATQINQHQNDGAPKVGYALSEAMQGDKVRAAWAMRRAFRVDPDSIHYIKIEQSLRPRIDKLIAEYNGYLYKGGYKYADTVFMIAALNYLLNNTETAHAVILPVVNKGEDDSQSTQNLYRLVK